MLFQMVKIMEFLGLKLAPFSLPMERRLQTFAVLVFISLLAIFAVGGNLVLLLIIIYTKLYYIPIVYYIWCWLDRKKCQRGGRRCEWVRRWPLWNWVRDYFPIKIIKTCDLDPNKNYVCGYHPHGIIAIGAFNAFCTEASNFSGLFPKLTPYLLTLNGQFNYPVYKDFLMSTGLCSVAKESVEWILTSEGKGNCAVIVTGGAMEALDAHAGLARLTLKKRKGFVRIALRHGASLLPIFSFGENELFSQYPNPPGSWIRKFQVWFTKFWGISSPFFYGRGIFQYSLGHLPYRKPVDIIVGKPIDIEKDENPSIEVVDFYHQKYLKQLNDLFEEHKMNYEHYKNSVLEFI